MKHILLFRVLFSVSWSWNRIKQKTNINSANQTKKSRVKNRRPYFSSSIFWTISPARHKKSRCKEKNFRSFWGPMIFQLETPDNFIRAQKLSVLDRNLLKMVMHIFTRFLPINQSKRFLSCQILTIEKWRSKKGW